MAPANPNPARITAPIWNLWIWFDALEPTVQLSGVYAAKGGYHDTRAGAGGGDYSVAEVANDRVGPTDKASAIDLTMSDAAMRKYTSRLDAAAKRRDERLYIGGAPIIREFIGTKDSRNVYCYVLTGGRARGLPADAAEDWRRDSTHLWHLHLSIIRKFCTSSDAMDRLYSVMADEPISAWKARRAPATPAPAPVNEDDMTVITAYPIPAGFAYDAEENWIEGNKSALSVPLPAVGSAGGHASVKSKTLFLSLAGDHGDPAKAPKVRTAIYNGAGWTVKVTEVPSGGRVSIPVPAASGGSAYNVTVGRVTNDDPENASLPLSLLVEIL